VQDVFVDSTEVAIAPVDARIGEVAVTQLQIERSVRQDNVFLQFCLAMTSHAGTPVRQPPSSPDGTPWITPNRRCPDSIIQDLQ
jgi:hypothetical protein